MRIERGKTFLLCAAMMGVASLLLAGQAGAVMLYAWETEGENLYSIDTAGPTATFIGGGNPSIIAEIEYDGMVIYGSDTGDNTLLHQIDPNTGLFTSTTVMTFPPEGNVITSMEIVGATLYGGLTTEGGGETYLATIDPISGVVSVVGGPTGVGSPLGGLAYDGLSMYAISAGGSAAELFTIDLGTGAATSIGLVTIDGVSIGATALEFGDDGVLYCLPNLRTLIPGHLLSINPMTADATDLGDTGVPGLVALTSSALTPTPTMPAWGLMLLGLVLVALLTIALGQRRRAA